MDAKTTETHDLLPWYAAGSLPAADRERFESHLRDCAACARELPVFQALRGEIDRHGEAFLAPHPPADRIVAEAMGDLEGPAATDVRRHLALCATCEAENRHVRRSLLGAAPALRERVVPAWLRFRPVLAGAAAAALAAALALPAWQALTGPGRASGVVPTHYVEAAQRGATETAIRVAPGAPGFQLVLPVDVGSEALPLSIEILDRAGRAVFARGGIDAIYQGRFLFVFCDRGDFPDGAYLARVRAPEAEAGQGAAIEYRFSVAVE